jgi:hypothetical protein
VGIGGVTPPFLIAELDEGEWSVVSTQQQTVGQNGEEGYSNHLIRTTGGMYEGTVICIDTGP